MSEFRPHRGVVTLTALRNEQGAMAESGTYVEGIAANIFYEVSVEARNGNAIAYRWVQPSGTRISEVLALRSARVGQEVTVNWSGNEPRFIIAEGLAPPEECGTSTAATLPPPPIESRQVDASVLGGGGA